MTQVTNVPCKMIEDLKKYTGQTYSGLARLKLEDAIKEIERLHRILGIERTSPKSAYECQDCKRWFANVVRACTRCSDCEQAWQKREDERRQRELYEAQERKRKEAAAAAEEKKRADEEIERARIGTTPKYWAATAGRNAGKATWLSQASNQAISDAELGKAFVEEYELLRELTKILDPRSRLPYSYFVVPKDKLEEWDRVRAKISTLEMMTGRSGTGSEKTPGRIPEVPSSGGSLIFPRHAP